MLMRLLLVAAFCGIFIAPTEASSAPFCVEAQGFPTECWYYDARVCRNEAAKRNGRCSANADEVSLPDQGAPFCIVRVGLVPVCAYHTGEDCDSEAIKQNAVCIEKSPEEQLDDPYRFDRPTYEY